MEKYQNKSLSPIFEKKKKLIKIGQVIFSR